MDIKSKVFTAVIQVALFIGFVGYYFSLYNNNKSNISAYTTFILIFACLNGAFFTKKKLDKEISNALIALNGILFVIWVIVVVVQLFI